MWYAAICFSLPIFKMLFLFFLNAFEEGFGIYNFPYEKALKLFHLKPQQQIPEPSIPVIINLTPFLVWFSKLTVKYEFDSYGFRISHSMTYYTQS